MRCTKFFASLLLLIVTPPSWAHQPEKGHFWLTGGPNAYQANFPSVPGYGVPPLMGGAGIMLEGDLDHHGGPEIGIFYKLNHYHRRDNLNHVVERVKRIYITMGYRHWVNSRFSGAAAVYSAYSIGDYTTLHHDYTNSRAVVNTSARDITEYGMDFSLQYEVYQSEFFTVLLDARYALNLTDKEHEDADEYGLLIGVKTPVSTK